ncbi:hypothetical protein [Microbacterium hominis]|uniref:Uncharacterized protein n=1 Tax=Microbacterium hominis TaxID=162426 RepID=A0A7D4TNY0_9MICO|nr:hypothetical protein [Microbacterium hominis]QKJ19922.1 hypothetical protein HQM25_11520 [Microbacterium hominis]
MGDVRTVSRVVPERKRDMRAKGLVRRLALWAVLAAVAVTSAGCSMSGNQSGPAPGASRTASSAVGDEEQQHVGSSEVARRVGQCLIDQGWDVTIGRDSVSSNTPLAQMDAYRAANDECYAIATADLPPPPTLSPELAVEEYNAQMLYRQCLLQHGVDAPALPSYQQFEDALLTGGEIYDGSWEAGLSQGDPLRIECRDPLDTWGLNSSYRAGQ